MHAGIDCISLWPGIVATERMAGLLSSGWWTEKTGFGTTDSMVESPVLSGRVIAALYGNHKDMDILKKRSGQVVVAAEAAREMEISDVTGTHADFR